MDIATFNETFRTNEYCYSHIFKLRWPNGFRCPACGNKDRHHIYQRNLLQCTKCRHQTSVTSGTIMHKTRITLSKWFYALFYVYSNCKTGSPVSASKLAREIGVSIKCSWTMLNKIRTSMRCADRTGMLLGHIKIVLYCPKGLLHLQRSLSSIDNITIYIAVKEVRCHEGAAMLAMDMLDERGIDEIYGNTKPSASSELLQSIENHLGDYMYSRRCTVKKYNFQHYLNEFCYFINMNTFDELDSFDVFVQSCMQNSLDVAS